MTDYISKDIVDLQDLEKVQFLQSLQSDPAKYAAYVGEKTDRIMSETVDTKRASFAKMSADMARMMDMNHNSLAALTRTNELIETEDMIITEQELQKNSRIYNKDLTRRQVEINNWYYENKRETLFLLQFVLLVVLSVVIVLYLAHVGFLTQQAADYVMGFIIVVGAGLWLYRWYYTNYLRDPRYWNSRKFNDGKFQLSGQICIGTGAGSEAASAASSGPVAPTCPAGSAFMGGAGQCFNAAAKQLSPPLCPAGKSFSPPTNMCV
jgi:hypothetical protein